MELPKYQWPLLKDVLIGLLTRVEIFLKRAGTIILGTTIVLWALASIPQAGPGQKQSEVSIAGHIADGIETVVKPIGFNHARFLAFRGPDAQRWYAELKARNCITDVRGDVLRIGFGIYQDESDVERLIALLAQL